MKTYQNISPAKFDAIRRAASIYGIKMETNLGNGEAFGVSVRWHFFPKCEHLEIHIVNAGMLSIPEALNFIDSIIQTA